jgi:EPS-associated MarR family transcriptional regulator
MLKNKHMIKKPDLFNLLRYISFRSNIPQRRMAKDLGFSLGKLNYCLKALNEKRLIKIQHLIKRKNKINYVQKYILTKKGINHRLNLTIKFMKNKMKEYDELKNEIKKTK